MRRSAPWSLACFKEVIKSVKIDVFFSAMMRRLFLITFYRTRVSRKCKSNGSVFCKKLLNPPQGKKMAVVSVLNRVKNKEMLAASGQESVVLAAEVEQLGNCLDRVVNFPELSCLSCARQVVRVVHFCTVITSHCWYM